MTKLYIMRGISGSGKSHCIKIAQAMSSSPVTVISSDKIREELTGDMACQSRNGDVFEVMEERLKNSILNGDEHVYVDATHLTKRSFTYIQRVIDEYEIDPDDVVIKQHHISVDSAIANVFRRQALGGLFVPEYVIKQQYKNFIAQQPYFDSLPYHIENTYTMKW